MLMQSNRCFKHIQVPCSWIRGSGGGLTPKQTDLISAMKLQLVQLTSFFFKRMYLNRYKPIVGTAVVWIRSIAKLITIAKRAENWNSAFVYSPVAALNRSTATVVAFGYIAEAGHYSSDENHNHKHLLQSSVNHFYTYNTMQRSRKCQILLWNKRDKRFGRTAAESMVQLGTGRRTLNSQPPWREPCVCCSCFFCASVSASPGAYWINEAHTHTHTHTDTRHM